MVSATYTLSKAYIRQMMTITIRQLFKKRRVFVNHTNTRTIDLRLNHRNIFLGAFMNSSYSSVFLYTKVDNTIGRLKGKKLCPKLLGQRTREEVICWKNTLGIFYF